MLSGFTKFLQPLRLDLKRSIPNLVSIGVANLLETACSFFNMWLASQNHFENLSASNLTKNAVAMTIVLVFFVVSGSGRAHTEQISIFLETVLDDSLLLLADRLVGSWSTDHFDLQGRVRLATDRFSFYADRVEANPDQASFTGNVTFRNQMSGFLANRVDFDRKKRVTTMQRAFFDAGDQFFTANTIQQESDGSGEVRDFVMAPCPDCSPVSSEPWRLYAREVVYDSGFEQIKLKNLQVSILGVPLFAVPRWQVINPSVERLSGFLQPKIGSSHAGGIALELGYFQEVSNAQDLTYKYGLHSEGAVEMAMKYRLSTADISTRAEVRMVALADSSDAKDALETSNQFVGDLDVSGDWFMDGQTRLRGQGRWESHDLFGEEFGHDTRDFRPTDIVLERFDGGTYAQVSLSQDRRSAEANTLYLQNQIPTRFQARYDLVNRFVKTQALGTLSANSSVDLQLARRGEGRDTSHLSAQGAIRLPERTWHGQRWQTETFVSFGVGQAKGLDSQSNDFAPTLSDFSGSSHYGSLGMSLEGSLPLIRRLGQAPTQITPRARLTHIAGDAPPSTLANEDALLPYLSAATLFQDPLDGPRDRGWTGTRLDMGFDTLMNSQRWTAQGFAGQRLQSSIPTYAPQFSGQNSRSSAALLQLMFQDTSTRLQMTYLGRIPTRSTQSKSQTFDTNLPIGSWKTGLSYAQESETEDLDGGENLALTITTPKWRNWLGKMKITENLHNDEPATIMLDASYRDCCFGFNLYYDQKDDDGERVQEIGFRLELIGLASVGQRGLHRF